MHGQLRFLSSVEVETWAPCAVFEVARVATELLHPSNEKPGQSTINALCESAVALRNTREYFLGLRVEQLEVCNRRLPALAASPPLGGSPAVGGAKPEEATIGC